MFAFDLSDYANIKYTDTGTIPGYSLSLNEFAFDSLIGIGYGDSSVTLKIELYESNDTAVYPDHKVRTGKRVVLLHIQSAFYR